MNLFVCKMKFWVAMVKEILVDKKSLSPILIPFNIVYNFLFLGKFGKFGCNVQKD